MRCDAPLLSCKSVCRKYLISEPYPIMCPPSSFDARSKILSAYAILQHTYQYVADTAVRSSSSTVVVSKLSFVVLL